ncbi:MAG: gliding motility-associated C-terminal domain-containing protein [Bacteroidia bacterium]
MKKLLLLFYSIFSLAFFTQAQTNLVPNPSFEIHDTSPDNGGQVSYAFPWFAPTIGSPDYFNACASTLTGLNVPSNAIGYQYARTGLAYCGFGLNVSDGYREYIEAPLLSSLIANKTYCVQFYVSLADNEEYAVSKIGAYFSNGAIVNNTIDTNLLYEPQVQNQNGAFLSNQQNWMLVSGDFVAQGGENYITIGDFNGSPSTDTLRTENGGTLIGVYYYIDDVSVYACGDSSIFSIPNVFTPNGDGKNDVFLIQDLPENSELIIYNRWGNIVYQSLNYQNDWKANGVSAGTYYYILKLPNKEIKKGFVQIIK